MKDLEWWCDFARVGVPMFTLGFLLGRVSETRKELTMKWTSKARSWFDKNVAVLYLGLAAIAVLGVLMAAWASVTNARQDSRAAAANKAAQVQSCLNANESREAHLLLWNFVVDLSSASTDENDDPPTPEELDALEQIRTWIGELFAPRDCTDLTKEYPIPPPPSLIGGPATEGAP